MNTQLFFIYDSHCPWSYATTSLVNHIAQAFPEITINLWHCARYEGDEMISKSTLDAVTKDSDLVFNQKYMTSIEDAQDSTLAANLLAWTQAKVPSLALPLLNAIQAKRFDQGIPLTTEEDFADVIDELKISPPAKVFNNKKLAKEAEFVLHDIFELQDVIETTAIPALLLAVDDNLTLLSHNFYLKQPESIVEAVELELKK